MMPLALILVVPELLLLSWLADDQHIPTLTEASTRPTDSACRCLRQKANGKPKPIMPSDDL